MNDDEKEFQNFIEQLADAPAVPKIDKSIFDEGHLPSTVVSLPSDATSVVLGNSSTRRIVEWDDYEIQPSSGVHQTTQVVNSSSASTTEIDHVVGRLQGLTDLVDQLKILLENENIFTLRLTKKPYSLQGYYIIKCMDRMGDLHNVNIFINEDIKPIVEKFIDTHNENIEEFKKQYTYALNQFIIKEKQTIKELM